jgi:hypothetical protein
MKPESETSRSPRHSDACGRRTLGRYLAEQVDRTQDLVRLLFRQGTAINDMRTYLAFKKPGKCGYEVRR